MAGVQNNTARQYNIRARDGDRNIVTIRLKPGFNVVNDEKWRVATSCQYVKDLKKSGLIEYGDMSLDKEASSNNDVSKSAQTKVAKTTGKKKNVIDDDLL